MIALELVGLGFVQAVHDDCIRLSDCVADALVFPSTGAAADFLKREAPRLVASTAFAPLMFRQVDLLPAGEDMLS